MLRYEMKRKFSDGRHLLRFEPREFLLRLCALVPPRGFHMVRYAGIFAAHARGRHALTGRGMRDRPTVKHAPPAAPPPGAGRPLSTAASPPDTVPTAGATADHRIAVGRAAWQFKGGWRSCSAAERSRRS
jgi:hypothetical protein